MPPQSPWAERPFAWWAEAKKASKSCASLKLGHLFSSLFPGDNCVLKWHSAGVDVQMTIQLIKKYFELSAVELRQAEIDRYFKPMPQATASSQGMAIGDGSSNTIGINDLDGGTALELEDSEEEEWEELTDERDSELDEVDNEVYSEDEAPDSL